jgi:hypothetical protein
MQAAGLQSVVTPSVYKQFALAEQINRLEFVKGVKHHKVGPSVTCHLLQPAELPLRFRNIMQIAALIVHQSPSQLTEVEEICCNVEQCVPSSYVGHYHSRIPWLVHASAPCIKSKQSVQEVDNDQWAI